MKTKEYKNGISLIVLVITVIVIIILALAVILSISGNNPIENARKARFLNDLRTMQEEVDLYEANQMATLIPSGEKYIAISISGKDMTDLFKTTEEYQEKVKVVLIDNKVSGKEKEWANQVGIDTKNEIKRTSEGIPIPIGFVASEATDENIKSKGLVIYEGEEAVTDENVEEARKTRNQFVWVPVDDINEFKMEDGYYMEDIEPNVSEGEVTEPLNYNETKAILDENKEYEAMISSVKEYKGFYIGRYETSNDGSGKAEIKKYKESWTNIKWANSMIDLNGGAVEKSRAVYPNSNIKDKGYAVSTLVYSVQWDQIIRWLKQNPKYYDLSKNIDIARDSTEFGNNYNSTFEYTKDNNLVTKKENDALLIPTGSAENNNLNNIYDLCGNVWEWTMASFTDKLRVYRDGNYGDSGNNLSISYYGSGYTGTDMIGFRIAMYIK